jgi:hypothetical protein
MQFSVRSEPFGRTSCPGFRCGLPSRVLVVQLLADPRAAHPLTISFKNSPKIHPPAGGAYGYEFRPD